MKEEADAQAVRLAVVFGLVLALSGVMLIILFRRNPARARQILLSFLSVEVLMVVRIGFDVLDFYTESVTHAGVRFTIRLIIFAGLGCNIKEWAASNPALVLPNAFQNGSESTTGTHRGYHRALDRFLRSCMRGRLLCAGCAFQHSLFASTYRVFLRWGSLHSS